MLGFESERFSIYAEGFKRSIVSVPAQRLWWSRYISRTRSKCERMMTLYAESKKIQREGGGF
jgi:hypothetical protein